jgi:hypothetical protein
VEAETSGSFFTGIHPFSKEFLNLETWKGKKFFVTGRGQM